MKLRVRESSHEWFTMVVVQSVVFRGYGQWQWFNVSCLEFVHVANILLSYVACPCILQSMIEITFFLIYGHVKILI